MAKVEAEREALAAENAALKVAISQHAAGFTVCEACGEENVSGNDDVCRVLNETPATDAFLREVKSQARQEGAYFVANRMLAAWDAGFIDDTAKNAADIARMILTSTEFMADAPEGDFERAFADGVLADIAAQLREGGDA
ncbi:ead/Ea22-like family protein [Cronobacter sakazakii]|nr:ead/Ea22-like family protein [Cronobacter sakazakii]